MSPMTRNLEAIKTTATGVLTRIFYQGREFGVPVAAKDIFEGKFEVVLAPNGSGSELRPAEYGYIALGMVGMLSGRVRFEQGETPEVAIRREMTEELAEVLTASTLQQLQQVVASAILEVNVDEQYPPVLVAQSTEVPAQTEAENGRLPHNHPRGVFELIAYSWQLTEAEFAFLQPALVALDEVPTEQLRPFVRAFRSFSHQSP